MHETISLAMLSVKYNLYSHRSFPLCFKEGESFIVTPGFIQLETKMKINTKENVRYNNTNNITTQQQNE